MPHWKRKTHITENDQVGFQVYGRYYVYGIKNNIAQGNLVQLFTPKKTFELNRAFDLFRIFKKIVTE